jgi:two-component system KDP operon response regulator KdpE
MESRARILIVDDEATIRTVIADALDERGFRVEVAMNADEALRACERATPDLVLLDLRMPGAMDGAELLRAIHQHWRAIAIIVLTGYATMDSAIAALREGASDYLIKPASVPQIVASVENALTKRREEIRRRELIAHLEDTLRELRQESATVAASAPADRFVQMPTLTIDRQKRLVVRGKASLALTATEFDLLDYLVQHGDRVVTASEIVKTIQGYDLSEPDARPLVRVHIQRLRQKLEDDPDNPRYILTVRAKGYRFVG